MENQVVINQPKQQLRKSLTRAMPSGLPERLAKIEGRKDKKDVYLSRFGEPIRNVPHGPIAIAILDLQKKMGVRSDNLTDSEELKTICQFIRDQYGSLTQDDFVNASKLLFMERLSNYDGRPLLQSHFQNVSLAFITMWLNSYQEFQLNAIAEINRLLPPIKEAEPTNYEKEVHNVKFIVEVVIPAIEYYRMKDQQESKEIEATLPFVFQFLESEGIYKMSDYRKWELMKRARQAKQEDIFAAIGNPQKLRAMKMAFFEAMGDLEGIDIWKAVSISKVSQGVYSSEIIRKLKANESVEEYTTEMIRTAVYNSMGS